MLFPRPAEHPDIIVGKRKAERPLQVHLIHIFLAFFPSAAGVPSAMLILYLGMCSLVRSHDVAYKNSISHIFICFQGYQSKNMSGYICGSDLSVIISTFLFCHMFR